MNDTELAIIQYSEPVIFVAFLFTSASLLHYVGVNTNSAAVALLLCLLATVIAIAGSHQFAHGMMSFRERHTNRSMR